MGIMAGGSLGRLNNLFAHLLDAVRVEKQAEQPEHKRARTLTRATPGLIVAALVWSLIFVLSIGTNGALAAALERHLTIPPYLVDAFSSLMGEREPETKRDLTALFVPSSVPEIEHFEGFGHPPFASNGSALALSVVEHLQKKSPDHGGLLGVNFMHEFANNASLNNQSPFFDFSAHPDARSRGGVANPNGMSNPGHAGRIVRGRASDEGSHGGQAPASRAPPSDVVIAPYANEPVIDSVPRAKSTPNTEPAKVLTLDDDLPTLAQPPMSLMNDDAPLLDVFLDSLLADAFAQPAAALVAARVPEPGTMALLVGAFVVWPIAKRVRIGSALGTRTM